MEQYDVHHARNDTEQYAENDICCGCILHKFHDIPMPRLRKGSYIITCLVTHFGVPENFTVMLE
jgi:hypothetical protein